jgi:hypothetical protein
LSLAFKILALRISPVARAGFIPKAVTTKAPTEGVMDAGVVVSMGVETLSPPPFAVASAAAFIPVAYTA